MERDLVRDCMRSMSDVFLAKRDVCERRARARRLFPSWKALSPGVPLCGGSAGDGSINGGGGDGSCGEYGLIFPFCLVSLFKL